MQAGNIIPPNHEIPDPPFMRWVVRIPAICVGLFFLFYLFFLIPGTDRIYSRIIDAIYPGESIPESFENDVVEEFPPGQVFNINYVLVTPPNQAVVKAGNIAVVCRIIGANTDPPNLYLDGTRSDWSFEPSEKVWLANLYLWPGTHTLNVGTNDVKLCAVKAEKDSHRLLTDPSVPLSWMPSYVHPDSNQQNKCFDCHKIPRDPRFAMIGVFEMKVDCYSCHEKTEMILRHGEITSKPINDCTSCHSIHGSMRRSLLKAPIEELLEELK